MLNYDFTVNAKLNNFCFILFLISLIKNQIIHNSEKIYKSKTDMTRKEKNGIFLYLTMSIK